MLKEANRPEADPVDEPYLLAASDKDDGNVRYIKLSDVFRIDDYEDRMRLAFRFHDNEVHFYHIPDMTYQQAREKIARLPHLRLIDLSEDLREQFAKAGKKNENAALFVKARRQEDGNERLIHIDSIKRYDDTGGSMRLAVAFKANETHLYDVPIAHFENAEARLAELQGRTFIDLRHM